MPYFDNSSIVLMVQSPTTVFCYFSISPMMVKKFEDKYGDDSWKNSKLVVKVYQITGGCSCEIKTVYLNDNSDNCYIKLDKCDIDIFVKIGRAFPNGRFIDFSKSNIVTTPRNYVSSDKSINYIKV